MCGTQSKAIGLAPPADLAGPLPLKTAMDWRASSSSASRPAPDTDWYVATSRRVSPASSCSGLSATTSWMVTQLGLATMPLAPKPSSASPFTSGTTSGPSARSRNSAVLSITMQPAATARGAYSRETAAPAENSAKSHCAKSKPASSRTGQLRPRKFTPRPRERSLASAYSFCTGKSRSSSTLTMVSPTRPVAPTMATVNALSMASARPSGARRADVRGGRLHVRVLRAMAQVVVHEHDGEHRLGDRCGPKPHARIMPAGGHDLDRVSGAVDGAARDLDARGGLERQVRDHILAGGDAPEHPSGMVAAKALRRQFIAVFTAALRAGARAGAQFDGLHGIDAHERMRNVRVQAIEHRLAQARRHPARHHRDARTDGIALAANLPDQRLDLGDALRIGAEKRVLVGEGGIDRVEHQRADPAEIAIDPHAQAGGQIAPRDGAGGRAHDRFAGRGASAAAVVAHAVFVLVGIVGVTGAEAVADLLVVARARIGVLDEDADRSAGRVPFKHPREDAHRIALTALADEVRGAGTAAIDVGLHIRLAQLQPRRAAIDDAAHRRPVALAEGRHRKELADGVARHDGAVRRYSCSRVRRNTPPPPRSN